MQSFCLKIFLNYIFSLNAANVFKKKHKTSLVYQLVKLQK